MQGLGALWLAHVLYPKQSKIHLNHEIQDFFKTFLQVDVTKAQARSLWQS